MIQDFYNNKCFNNKWYSRCTWNSNNNNINNSIIWWINRMQIEWVSQGLILRCSNCSILNKCRLVEGFLREVNSLILALQMLSLPLSLQILYLSTILTVSTPTLTIIKISSRIFQAEIRLHPLNLNQVLLNKRQAKFMNILKIHTE